MTPEQAQLFIDYVVGMPDANAAQYVELSAMRFDETFFAVLKSLIVEAKSDSSPPAVGRQRALNTLLTRASHARQQAFAQFSPSIKLPPRQPPDDFSKAKQLIDLDKRVTAMLMRTRFNVADEQLIVDWKNILDGYRQLLESVPPRMPLYTHESVRLKVAQTLESIAGTYDALHDASQARSYYQQAAVAFDDAGDAIKASRCRAMIVQNSLEEESDVDGELRRAVMKLSVLPKNSLEYWGQLVELGELQSRAHDDYQATDTLLKAEAGLRSMGYDNPSGSDLAVALTQTLKGIAGSADAPGAIDIQTSLQIQGLHRRIQLTLGQAYRSLGDNDKARKRLDLAKSIDSRQTNDEFPAQMLKASPGGVG